MNRRGFFGRLAAVAVGAVAAANTKTVSDGVLSVTTGGTGLSFHKDAFSMVWPTPQRLDVLYGVGMVKEPLGIVRWDA